jgi:hypothetical protein
MWRYLVGLAAGVLLVLGGVLWWQSSAGAREVLPDAPAARTASIAVEPGADEVPLPPRASEKTREEKRFARYDKDKNGGVSRDEFLAARKRAFAKLDLNGDGALSFDEYAIKGRERFAKADADKTGVLTAAEFATTRVVRATRSAAKCPPARETSEEGGS